MPVYNAERFLRVSLGSVLAAAKALETGDEAEIICVDDGSTDASGAILDEMAAHDPRVRVVHQANGGEGSARNAGLAVATGDLLAFLDADDVFHPVGLRLICAVRRATGADVLRYGWRPVTTHDGKFEPLPGPECARSIDFATARESTIRFCTAGCATVVARAIVGDVRFSKLRQGADLVFAMDCFLRANKVVRIDAPILHYLTHASSVSQKLSIGLVAGTCDYLPEVVARCAALKEGAAARADTRAYVCELLFRRLVGSWRLFADPAERESVRQAFWRCLGALSERTDFFSPCARALARQAVRRQSVIWLRIFVILPWRIAGRGGR